VDPDEYTRPVFLELNYQIEPRQGADAGEDIWGLLEHLWTRLYPPVLRGAAYHGTVRWQVQVPPGQMLLNPGESAASEEKWGRRGWLLGPQSALGIKALELWLATGSSGAAPDDDEDAGLVCRQTVPAPLVLVQVPQKTWLLVCSVLLLCVGLGVSFLPLSRGLFHFLCWIVVLLAGGALVAAVVVWPALFSAVVYGCEPGAAVLMVVLVIQWMLQRRYRRQLVFLPGFTRLKAGSVLTRGSSNRPREPSTVDAPPVADISAARSTPL
jgi:hypothetical protein